LPAPVPLRLAASVPAGLSRRRRVPRSRPGTGRRPGRARRRTRPPAQV